MSYYQGPALNHITGLFELRQGNYILHFSFAATIEILVPSLDGRHHQLQVTAPPQFPKDNRKEAGLSLSEQWLLASAHAWALPRRF